MTRLEMVTKDHPEMTRQEVILYMMFSEMVDLNENLAGVYKQLDSIADELEKSSKRKSHVEYVIG